MTIRKARPIASRSVIHGLLCGAIALSPILARSDPPTVPPARIATPLRSPVEQLLRWELPADLRLIDTSPGSPTDPGIAAELRVIPRGNEMSALATVDLERTDRHFRADVVEWFAARSVAAGVVSDVVVRGSDRGLHLHVRGSGLYMLLGETRF